MARKPTRTFTVSPRAYGEQGFDVLCGPWWTEIEPLHLVAALLLEAVFLLHRLDPFAHDPQPQAVRHGDDGGNDRGVRRIAREVPHERAVDLERVDRDALETAERGLPDAEVVDAQVDAEILEPAQRDGGRMLVSHHASLGELELE